MKFEEYQEAASKIPVAMRNNRDRITLPVLGLQSEAGKVDSILSTGFASGRLTLTVEQRREIKKRLADVLWYVALLCHESGVAMSEVATLSISQLEARTDHRDLDER